MLETYLKALTTLRGATTPEMSYYAALQTLFNDVGAELRPKVRAAIELTNRGGGEPDLGLFDENQPSDQKPARGIVEVKPASHDLLTTARSEQVTRYLEHYGQALYTFIQRSQRLPDSPPSLRQAVRWIAQLGGFLGRKGDGEPGVKVLWRGWTRLQDIVSMWLLSHPLSDQNVGNA